MDINRPTTTAYYVNIIFYYRVGLTDLTDITSIADITGLSELAGPTGQLAK